MWNATVGDSYKQYRTQQNTNHEVLLYQYRSNVVFVLADVGSGSTCTCSCDQGVSTVMDIWLKLKKLRYI